LFYGLLSHKRLKKIFVLIYNSIFAGSSSSSIENTLEIKLKQRIFLYLCITGALNKRNPLVFLLGKSK